MIKPSNILPLRFVNPGSEVDKVQSFQVQQCYDQKWELGDTLVLQAPSYGAPTNLILRDTFGIQAISIPWTLKDVTITNQTFQIYEISQPLAVLQEDRYQAEFSYYDENGDAVPQISDILSIQEEQLQTVLITYRNSSNNFDVIFNTGIEFQFRVEGSIEQLTAKNNRNTYEDQDANLTLLSATPFNQRKFYLGYQYGVPEWVWEKVNWIQSVNQTAYDGVSYQVDQGAEWEINRNTLGNSWVGGSIDIRFTENRFNRYESEQTPIDPENIFTPMQKRLRYFNVGADMSIPNVFNDWSQLDELCITKRSLPTFNITVGITPGGDEIGIFPVDSFKFNQEVKYFFESATTLYLSGLAGTDVDIIIIYKQLDVDDIDISDIGGGGGAPEPTGSKFPLNFVGIYGGTDAQLDVDFDITTGLGRANTEYYGCAIVDGRNGTDDWRGYALVGHKPGDADFGGRGIAVGEKTVGLTVAQLPKHRPVLRHSLSKRGSTGSDALIGKFNGDNSTELEEIGNNEQHPNIQPSIPVTLFKRIF